MSNYIKKAFSKYLDIKITNKHIIDIIQTTITYGIRDEHSSALNSPLIGVNKLYFTSVDQTDLFEIFDYVKSDIVKIIKDIPSINKDWVVISDSYNLFTIWLVHLLLESKHKDAKKATYCLLNMLQYKFFSSILNQYYPYKVNEEIMRFTVENLTKKYDIIEYRTWRKVIFHRSENVIDRQSIHYNTLKRFHDDGKILYIISDIQTRIRNQIKVITAMFHENKEINNTIKNYSPTQDIDGLKIIKDLRGTTDIIKHNIKAQIINKDLFITDSYIKLVSSLFKLVNTLMIRRFLEYMCDSAKEQLEITDLKSIIQKRDFKYYNDINLLSFQIIKVIYEYCFNNNTNIKSKVLILQVTKQLISSSRSQNENVINIRQSLKMHIKNSNISTKDTTISSLITIYALYMILKSFEFV